MDSSNHLQTALFRHACRQLDPTGDLEQALVLMPDGIATSEIGADPKLAADVAARAGLGWDRSERAVQIQYAHFEGYDEPLVLYKKPTGSCLVILVAGSDVLLSRLRRIADTLVHVLNEGEGRLSTSQSVAIESLVDTDVEQKGVYAIAWRPVEPLPRAMRKVVRACARQLARRNGCQLHFLGVASDHVHLVLRCPAHRGASWAAYVFKRGIETEIARRYGTSVKLWQKGFLAVSSSDPIGGEALLAYLGR